MIVNTTYTSGGVVSKRLLLKKVLNRMKKNIFALTFFFKIHKNITKNNSVNLNDLIHHKGLWKQCHQAAAGWYDPFKFLLIDKY